MASDKPRHPYGENIRIGGAYAPQNSTAAPCGWDNEDGTDAFVPVLDLILKCDGRSGSRDLECAIAQRLCDLFDLFCERQRKYGPGNIAAFGEQGCVVRASDKLARLRRHYFEGGQDDMPDESVRDAWADLAVYGAIALVCRDGLWPGGGK